MVSVMTGWLSKIVGCHHGGFESGSAPEQRASKMPNQLHKQQVILPEKSQDPAGIAIVHIGAEVEAGVVVPLVVKTGF